MGCCGDVSRPGNQREFWETEFNWILERLMIVAFVGRFCFRLANMSDKQRWAISIGRSSATIDSVRTENGSLWTGIVSCDN
jgi:hypothetical protein